MSLFRVPYLPPRTFSSRNVRDDAFSLVRVSTIVRLYARIQFRSRAIRDDTIRIFQSNEYVRMSAIGKCNYIVISSTVVDRVAGSSTNVFSYETRAREKIARLVRELARVRHGRGRERKRESLASRATENENDEGTASVK